MPLDFLLNEKKDAFIALLLKINASRRKKWKSDIIIWYIKLFHDILSCNKMSLKNKNTHICTERECIYT